MKKQEVLENREVKSEDKGKILQFGGFCFAVSEHYIFNKHNEK